MWMRFLLFSLFIGLLVPLPGFAAEKVGVSSAVNQAANGKPPDSYSRSIKVGEKILHDERIVTNKNGQVQILLDDGTTFTVGPNAQLTIDSFVYNPKHSTAKVVASMGKGVFRFIGALTSKTPHGVRLHTPVGTAGIRGAIVNLVLRRSKQDPIHIDLLYGRFIVLKLRNGRIIRLDTPGYSIVVDKKGAYIEKTPIKFLEQVQELIEGTPGRHGGATTRLTDEMVALAHIMPEKSGFGNGAGSIVCRPLSFGKNGVQNLSDPATWASQ